MPIQIRPVNPSTQALPLYSVFHSSVHTLASRHYTREQCEAWAPMQCDESTWVARIAHNRPFVAWMDDTIAGFADLQPDGYIDQFFVSSACAGRGVGSALMAFLLETARTRGVPGLYSHVSLTAQPLFLRHGFRIDARQTVHLRGTAFENARMSLMLSQPPVSGGCK